MSWRETDNCNCWDPLGTIKSIGVSLIISESGSIGKIGCFPVWRLLHLSSSFDILNMESSAATKRNVH